MTVTIDIINLTMQTLLLLLLLLFPQRALSLAVLLTQVFPHTAASREWPKQALYTTASREWLKQL